MRAFFTFSCLVSLVLLFSSVVSSSSTAQRLASLVHDAHSSAAHVEVDAWHNSTLLSFRRRASDADAVRVLIVCGIHGREHITFDVCAHWTRMLAVAERASPLDIALVPLLNPLGMARAEREPCWRGNALGVDLNRNFALLPHFTSDVVDESALEERMPNVHTLRRRSVKEQTLGDESYAGPAPFSEPETRALLSLLEHFKPDVLIAVHSGTRAVLVPYDSLPDVTTPNKRQLLQFAHWLVAGVCSECKVGVGAQLLYPASGTLTDYAYWYGTADIALTLEIYGEALDSRATLEQQGGCKCAFNPCDEKTHADTLQRWAGIMQLLLTVEPDDVATLRSMVRHSLVSQFT